MLAALAAANALVALPGVDGLRWHLALEQAGFALIHLGGSVALATGSRAVAATLLALAVGTACWDLYVVGPRLHMALLIDGAMVVALAGAMIGTLDLARERAATTTAGGS